MEATLDKAGRLVIPKKIREQAGLTAGTRVEVSMWHDNSTDNSWVPNPNRAVGFGGMTNDEMNIGWLEYANAEAIDDIAAHDFGDQGTGVEDIDDSRFD